MFCNGFIEGWFKIDLVNVVYQGWYDFDGGLGDWSVVGLKCQLDFLYGVIDKVSVFKDLKFDEVFECDYLVQVVKGKLFWLEDVDQLYNNL